jgi:fructose-bisphosphate aldolase class 1
MERVMQQITIRGIAPEIEKKIRRVAKSNRQSINHVIKETINKAFEKKAKRPRASTLKKLAGGWSQEDAADFKRAIRSCEQIDGDMWR